MHIMTLCVIYDTCAYNARKMIDNARVLWYNRVYY